MLKEMIVCSEAEKEEEERGEEGRTVSLCYVVSKTQRVISNRPAFPCRNKIILSFFFYTYED